MNIMTNRNRLFAGLIGTIAIALSICIFSSSVGAAAPDEVEWNIEVNVPFTSEQVQQPGWEASTQALQAAMAARMRNDGAQLQTKKTLKSAGVEYAFLANGKGNLTQFKQVLFDDLGPVGGMTGGATQLTIDGSVKRGENVAFLLESNPSTGYTWQIQDVNRSVLNPTPVAKFEAKSNLLGAPMKQTINLSAGQDASTAFTLVYRRPWESETPTRHVTLHATRLASLADLTSPLPSSSISPQQKASMTTRAPEALASLPSSFDWRNNGGVNYLTAVRNQGSCGSCWAFATVGPFEASLLWKDGLSTNLSEQFLVSCNTENPKWGCAYGGWWAHDYHINKTAPGDTQAGAVLEPNFPYSATDATCYGPYVHAYKLSNWYRVPSPGSVPTVTAIKTAISTYGPVAAAICAGSHFSSYGGGVFSDPDGSDCNNYGINHAIVLVGWDDSTGTWILRNSWGPYWGESGYMRIAYGTSQVGYDANYVVYNGDSSCSSLTTWVAGSGTLNVSPTRNCSSNNTFFSAGTAVTLTATPNSGSRFFAWGGDANGSTNPKIVTVDTNKSIYASFARNAPFTNFLFVPSTQK
jgi:C1A family cysteine protease